MKIIKLIIITCVFVGILTEITAQPYQQEKTNYWYNKERSLRYHPEGNDFVIFKGNKRFNRALYGTNTAFRIEGGDLPEFALYMPGMGGNFKIGIIKGEQSKWMIKADSIKAIYRPGSMIYEIRDNYLGKGFLTLTLLAMDNAEGMVIKATFHDISENLILICAFGGATGEKFTRDGELNIDPESSFYLKPENCRSNSYKIQANSFILNYGAGKVKSESDRYEIQNPNPKNSNQEENTKKEKNQQQLIGAFPERAELFLADATKQETPLILSKSFSTGLPAITGKIVIRNKEQLYFLIQNPASKPTLNYSEAAAIFNKAEEARLKLANRITIDCPDPFIRSLGGALGIAADAIWEAPTYLHGSIGWRMRLNGWRGPYTADPLGWHDRAKMHFRAYAKSQVSSPDSGPNVPDPDKNFARQQEKMGNSLFTSGYICRNPNGDFRPHHYDMNLVFIDALMRHLHWTGNKEYIKEMWPLIKRHLAWEKRCFDADNDGLYDAYCCIWASDALEYSSGGVTHSSAYNYLAYKMAAKLAGLIGESSESYQKEADKISDALKKRLWMPSKGWFAEYQDLLGLKQLHPTAALWTIYHTIDSEVPDAFEAWQMMRYVDNEIPHIPVRATGLKDEDYYLLSTTNWMPYTWSLNNVVMAENLHTSLAFWQSSRKDEAYKLWKSTLLDAMYLGSSPANFVQVSFYDAARGEVYRDFADEIGMTARTLVEGLFGIHPDALSGVLTIKPGFPEEWDHASLNIPDISLDYKELNNTQIYTIVPKFGRSMKLKFMPAVRFDFIEELTVNGVKTDWTNVIESIEFPLIEINCEAADKYNIVIKYKGDKIEKSKASLKVASGDKINFPFGKAKINKVFDPQKILSYLKTDYSNITFEVNGENGHKTFFVNITQGEFTWWMPVYLEKKDAITLLHSDILSENTIKFSIQNNANREIKLKAIVNPGILEFKLNLILKPLSGSDEITIPTENVITGSNLIQIKTDKEIVYSESIINWNNVSSKSGKFETIPLNNYFNDKVTNIFKNKYLEPRSPYPTLQIPIHGIGNWCYPMINPEINDTGLRKLAGSNNEFTIPQGIPFSTPAGPDEKNIVFTSQWKNYPTEIKIPLTGNASHAYFLMAGSTNPMQSRLVNGTISAEYEDGTSDKLDLTNPETWWPIEQDYIVDQYAFPLYAPKPIRLHLKTGLITSDFNNYSEIKGFSNKAIEGGAATIFDLPLKPDRKLKSINLKALANEVVIGLMSVTLQR